MKKINNKKDINKPHVVILGCVHGDELIGKKIIDGLKRIEIKKGILSMIIGNEKAVKRKKRFIDQDLNRSFPGKKNGNHEEKRAFEIKNIINKADYVIDIHSTTTDVKNLAIITKVNRATLNLIHLLSPVHVALMKQSIGKDSLTYHCRAGVTIEYGKDKDTENYEKILVDMKMFLAKLGMTGGKIINKKKTAGLFKIKGVVPKPRGFAMTDGIKNFHFIKKGDVIGKKGNTFLKAEKNLYPILFGKKSYEDIFGFYADKVNKF